MVTPAFDTGEELNHPHADHTRRFHQPKPRSNSTSMRARHGARRSEVLGKGGLAESWRTAVLDAGKPLALARTDLTPRLCQP